MGFQNVFTAHICLQGELNLFAVKKKAKPMVLLCNSYFSAVFEYVTGVYACEWRHWD